MSDASTCSKDNNNTWSLGFGVLASSCRPRRRPMAPIGPHLDTKLVKVCLPRWSRPSGHKNDLHSWHTESGAACPSSGWTSVLWGGAKIRSERSREHVKEQTGSPHPGRGHPAGLTGVLSVVQVQLQRCAVLHHLDVLPLLRGQETAPPVHVVRLGGRPSAGGTDRMMLPSQKRRRMKHLESITRRTNARIPSEPPKGMRVRRSRGGSPEVLLQVLAALTWRRL